MPTRKLPDKFLVAFSLAGEQRELVRKVAEAVEQRVGSSNVFLDEWYEHYVAGGDGDTKLQKIYGEGCILAVICVSQNYGDKPWTKAEHAAIRARYMKAKGEKEKLGILPIRVGDGEVEGILFNYIVPDIRKKSISEAASLIVDRLYLIVPPAGEETPTAPDWPELPAALHWPMADHSAVRDAFKTLLTAQPQFRFLPVRGASEVGKTQVTNQMLRYALQTTGLACGRFDLKGTTDMDAEVRSFVQDLEAPVPPASPRLSERLGQILDALRQRKRPALLIFDTYNLAPGEVKDWVERQLLQCLIKAPWLRVVIAGQQVPEPSGAVWESVSSPVVTLLPPPADDWFEFSKLNKRDVSHEFVLKAYQESGGKASVMTVLCGPRG